MKTTNKLNQAANLIEILAKQTSPSQAEFLRKLSHRERCLGVKAPQFREWVAPNQSWVSPNPIVRAAHFSKVSGSYLPVQWAASRAGARFVPGKEYYTGHSRFSDLYLDARKEVSKLRTQVEESIFDDAVIDSEEATGIALSWMRFCLWADGVVSLMKSDALKQLGESIDRIHEDSDFVPSYVCVHDALRSSSRSAKEIAEACGFKQAASVNKWGEESGRAVSEFRGRVIDDTQKKSGIPSPFDYTVRLVEITRSTRPISLMCEILGGSLVEAPSIQTKATSDLHKSWVKVDTELAEFMGAIGKAVEDERLDPAETEKIAREWLDVRCWMETFVSRCGRGDFSNRGSASFLSR